MGTFAAQRQGRFAQLQAARLRADPSRRRYFPETIRLFRADDLIPDQVRRAIDTAEPCCVCCDTALSGPPEAFVAWFTPETVIFVGDVCRACAARHKSVLGEAMKGMSRRKPWLPGGV